MPRYISSMLKLEAGFTLFRDNMPLVFITSSRFAEAPRTKAGAGDEYQCAEIGHASADSETALSPCWARWRCRRPTWLKIAQLSQLEF